MGFQEFTKTLEYRAQAVLRSKMTKWKMASRLKNGGRTRIWGSSEFFFGAKGKDSAAYSRFRRFGRTESCSSGQENRTQPYSEARPAIVRIYSQENLPTSFFSFFFLLSSPLYFLSASSLLPSNLSSPISRPLGSTALY